MRSRKKAKIMSNNQPQMNGDEQADKSQYLSCERKWKYLNINKKQE